MAYKLACVNPYHCHRRNGMYVRGEIVSDKHTIAQIYHLDNREHHFVKSYNTDKAVEYWNWPPPHPDTFKKAVPEEDEDA